MTRPKLHQNLQAGCVATFKKRQESDGSGPGETQGLLKRGTTSGGWIRSHSSSRYWSVSEGKSAAVAATPLLAPLKNIPLSAARKNQPMGVTETHKWCSSCRGLPEAATWW